ncbi:MAG TPA: Crp/Fnr family transcriptional regulator [Actinomycetota bacterium]|nr:Crp/Fnr family transcriptional regulator [Actinomycetota bacterium]
MSAQLANLAGQASVNFMLLPLPGEQLRRVLDVGEVVRVTSLEPAFAAGEPVAHVHFPLTAIFSLVARVDGHKTVEVATVGNEGLVGLSVFLGASTTLNEAFCQVPGESLRVPAADFRRLLPETPMLRRQLARFTQATLIQTAQAVACNTAHTVSKRAARRLLMTQDRVGKDTFPMTQEFLGLMLGVRRATVSEAASELQSGGLIRYSRGVMTVVDRRGLEEAACSCYAVVRAEFDELRSL